MSPTVKQFCLKLIEKEENKQKKSKKKNVSDWNRKEDKRKWSSDSHFKKCY